MRIRQINLLRIYGLEILGINPFLVVVVEGESFRPTVYEIGLVLV